MTQTINSAGGVIFAVVLALFFGLAVYSSIPEEVATVRRYMRRNKVEIELLASSTSELGTIKECVIVNSKIGRYSMTHIVDAKFSKLTDDQKQKIKQYAIQDIQDKVKNTILLAELAKQEEN